MLIELIIILSKSFILFAGVDVKEIILFDNTRKTELTVARYGGYEVLIYQTDYG